MSAISHLERDGGITIYVKKRTRLLGKIVSFRLRKKLSRSSQAEILSNISLMLRTGVPLTTALEETAVSSEVPEVGRNFNDMIISIQGGATFSEAADNYRHIFPETVIYLIRIGEETGKLSEMLKDASDHLKRIQNIVSDTKQALLYPSFVFVAMSAGFLFWFYYVVPKILTLFKEMDVSLPPITIYVMNISYFIQDYFVYILSGMVLIIFFILIARKHSRRFRKSIDALLLKIPLSGNIISASVLAFITEYFSLLINVGMDILQSVTILKESIKNEVYREKLGEVRESLTRGEGIADSFKAAVIFPVFVTRMLSIGEMSGTLSEQLAYIAEEYKNKLNIIVATIGKALEPVVLVVAGTMFAIIIGALLLPIYDLVSQLSVR
jgi:general secretion pathway protein F/type IV pilus assembly protein PilC